ncbi:hypothetical protein [Acinetobacter sp. UBA3106]|uniref:hypothetical protein n=1 Tax=Acinetobacter sp. UBA3106 TaxID=1945936 RepID=UPI0025C1E95A|nr:hypothetical protein [Acinetobacter sp. UBA3106]
MKQYEALFKDDEIDKYPFEEIPLDTDCILMSEMYMEDFDKELQKMLQGKDSNPYKIGYGARVAFRKINSSSINLSWYANTHTRFHEVSVTLSKEKIKKCVGCWRYDIKPYVFVDHEWLEQLYLKEYSIFALIDAIGVKKAIQDGILTKDKLIELRNAIDELAHTEKDIAFISFADSLILKTNWVIGYFDKGITSSYKPEKILHVIKELDNIYQDILGLPIYAVLTQGDNEYHGESLLHISKNQNHICLNSLGVPFAELMAIENSAKKAIKTGIHPPAQLYLDEQFYRSIDFKFEFQKNDKPKNLYSPIMKSTDSNYFYGSCNTLLDNLKNDKDKI